MRVRIFKEDEMGDVVELLEAISLVWNGKRIDVPAGFRCDGVSVPQFLWSTISPPIDPRSLRAGIYHDFLYRTTPEGWTRKEADDLFYDLLREDGLGWYDSQKSYYGVRWFGASAWKGE